MVEPTFATKCAGPPEVCRKAGSTITRLGFRRTARHAAMSLGYEPRSSSLGGPLAMKLESNAVRFQGTESDEPLTVKLAVVVASGAIARTPGSLDKAAGGMGFDALDQTATE